MGRCGAGLETVLADDDVELPDLIFADYFLDPHITAANDGSDEERQRAKTASISRLDELLQPSLKANKHPPIILMSSKDVKNRADDYRVRVSAGEGKVFASRFGFIRKTDLKVGARPHPNAPEPVEIARPSADVLLDIIQSHPFGQRLHEALKLWIAGSQAGVDRLKSDIEEMELRDFAYLVTHRLAQEEIGLFDYLEWFFGECLLGSIADACASSRFKWSKPCQSRRRQVRSRPRSRKRARPPSPASLPQNHPVTVECRRPRFVPMVPTAIH